LEKEKIVNKIPIKAEKTNVKESNEAKEIKALLESLEKQKTKMLEVVNNIFILLNENNVTQNFIKVLQNKTTENAVFNEKKLEFDEKFKILEAVSEEIKKIKSNITEKMQAFNNLKLNASKLGEENQTVKILI
jgi:hypothetical protein